MRRVLVLVPSCAQCNLLAGAAFDWTDVAGKRRYIQRALYRKYAKLLKTPEWEDDEIEELGRTLGSKVRANQANKARIRQRVLWPYPLTTRSKM